MEERTKSHGLSRRAFAAGLAVSAPSIKLMAQEAAGGAPPRKPNEDSPFHDAPALARNPAPVKVQPFPMTAVRLTAGPFRDAQEWNRSVLLRLPADRLVHNFRVNAGLPSSAEPLGGWEKPDCELRGHFTGHFLSACALMYASTGDQTIKAKGDAIVAELAACQAKLAGGYLSAFPLEFFDRLGARRTVWAPFYTIHKIMAGMLDMYQHCGNRQALEVLQGMAGWTAKWTRPIPLEHMQDILNTEYGGMNEVLYNLSAVTSEEQYARTGDCFTKNRFFNPLALRRDELRGLHVNTHIPQVIGAARRYELSSDERFHDVADYFWYEVTTARAYVTGGTSNNEGWLTEPRRLAAELKRHVDTAECCCAYNMLKLTRHLYGWTADPRYFDYYERTLLNHRLGAIHPGTGATMYYLSLAPGAWKTFNTDYDSFWCCTGTGVEEFSKLNDSIYFYDGGGIYVNLFIPSELDWAERGVTIRQQTMFPEEQRTTIVIGARAPLEMAMHLRVPHWLTSGGSVKVNGKMIEGFSSPGSYFTISRVWSDGDRLEIQLPMDLHTEALPDDSNLQAILYGPLVLAGKLGDQGLTDQMIFGPMGPSVAKHPMQVPGLRTGAKSLDAWIKRLDTNPLTFRISGQKQDMTLTPLNQIFRQRYAVYWSVS